MDATILKARGYIMEIYGDKVIVRFDREDDKEFLKTLKQEKEKYCSVVFAIPKG